VHKWVSTYVFISIHLLNKAAGRILSTQTSQRRQVLFVTWCMSRLSATTCRCHVASSSAVWRHSEAKINHLLIPMPVTSLCAKNRDATFVAAMLCIARPLPSCGVCVSVCVCVRVSITFVSWVKTNKQIIKIFSPSGSHTILVFPCQTAWQYSDGDPLTGASNAGGVGRNRVSELISL